MTKMKKNGRTYIDVKFRAIFIASTFSMLIEYLMSLTDKILSGNMLGSGALAAITLVEPFTLLMAFVACVLSGITGAPVTAALGRGEQEKAERYFSQSLLLAVFSGLLLTAVYVLFTEKLIGAVADTPEQATNVREYFLWLRFLPLPMMLNAVLYPVALYRGGEKYCNLSAGFSVVSNIGLSVGLCRLIGLRGIGVGTVVGSCFGLAPLILFMLTPKGRMRISLYLSFRDIRDNLVYSLGSSLSYFYMAVLQIVMNLFLVRRFSDDAIVLFTGVTNVVGLMAALSSGITEFLIPMLNTYRGERNELGCKRVMEKARRVSIGEGLVLMLVLLVFAPGLAVLFGVENPALASGFAGAVRIYALSSCFFYVAELYIQYYLYAGRQTLSLGLGCLKSLVLPLAFGLGFGHLFGLTGVWVGMSLAQAAALGVGWLLLRFRKQAGRDLLFLDAARMEKQHMWNVPMERESIMELVELVRTHLRAEGVPDKQRNRAALAIEESQMGELMRNKKTKNGIIECSLLENEDITIILRNTGECGNILENSGPDALPTKLLTGLPGMTNSYFLVNGNNRLIFHITGEKQGGF